MHIPAAGLLLVVTLYQAYIFLLELFQAPDFTVGNSSACDWGVMAIDSSHTAALVAIKRDLTDHDEM